MLERLDQGTRQEVVVLAVRFSVARRPTRAKNRPRHLQLRLEKLPAEVQAIGWTAQVRLCKRYRQLTPPCQR